MRPAQIHNGSIEQATDRYLSVAREYRGGNPAVFLLCLSAALPICSTRSISRGKDLLPSGLAHQALRDHLRQEAGSEGEVWTGLGSVAVSAPRRR